MDLIACGGDRPGFVEILGFDQRSFEKEVNDGSHLPRAVFGLPESRKVIARQALKMVVQTSLMRRCFSPHRMVRMRDLSHRINEGAAAELGFRKPVFQECECCQNLVAAGTGLLE